MPRLDDATSLQERQENLAIRKEEDALAHSKERAGYELEKARTADRDRRWMAWTLFGLAVVFFVFALLGATVFNWGTTAVLPYAIGFVGGMLAKPPLLRLAGHNGNGE